MIYGIQASKDVKLSNISRALMEPVPLIKTEDRLSRNLSDEDLTCTINHHIMRLADDKIDDTMVISIDPGDMMKPNESLPSLREKYSQTGKGRTYQPTCRA